MQSRQKRDETRKRRFLTSVTAVARVMTEAKES